MSKFFATVAIIAIIAVCAQADTQKWATDLPQTVIKPLRLHHGNKNVLYATTSKHVFVIANTSLYAVDLATGSIAWSRDAYPLGYQTFYTPRVYASEKMVVVYSHSPYQGSLLFIDPISGNVMTNVNTTLSVQNVFFMKHIFVIGGTGYMAYKYTGEPALPHYNLFSGTPRFRCASVAGNEILVIFNPQAEGFPSETMWLVNEENFQKRAINNVTWTFDMMVTDSCTPNKDGYLTVLAKSSSKSSDSGSASSSSSTSGNAPNPVFPGSSSSSSSSFSSSGADIFSLLDVNTGNFLWQKEGQPENTWLFDDVLYTTTSGSGPLNAYDLKSGKLISTTSIPSNVQAYGVVAFEFSKKVAFWVITGLGPVSEPATPTYLTVVEPATGQILNSTFVPATSMCTCFYELPDSLVVINPQGLTRIDKVTMQPVYRTLDMGGILAFASMPGGYLALYGSTIAYFEV